MLNRHLQRAFIGFSLCTLLAACGGGSGSSGGPSNTAPIADAQVFKVKNTDAARTGTVTGTDPDGDALQFEKVSDPSSGTLTSFSTTTGEFTYQPAAGAQVGQTDSFTFRVRDGSTVSATQTVTVQIVSQHTANPALFYVASEGSLLSVATASGVIERATNPVGETLTVTITDAPDHAAAFVMNADGSFDYTHDGSENPLIDAFTYELRAANGDTSSATANINITPVNDAPVISTPLGCPKITRTGNLVANVGATDPESDLMTFALVSDGSKGSLNGSLNTTTGGFTYTPTGTQYGLDSFTIRIQDVHGATRVETIYVNLAAKVMPLGDSITEGVTDGSILPEPGPSQPNRIGYRKRLKELLEADGYSIDFVGTRNVAQLDTIDPNGGYGYNLFADFESEGHGGTNANFFQTNTATAGTWLDRPETRPEVVLLHVGTNDFTTLNPTATGADTSVNGIVNNIHAWNANTEIFVARIIGQHTGNPDGITPANVTTFNNNVQALIGAIANVTMVDLFSELDYTHPGADWEATDPGKHPNQTGYDKMAARWATDIAASGELEQCPN